MLFASDWLMKNPDTPHDSFGYFTEPKDNSKALAAQIFADGPTQRRGTTPQFLTTLIGQAKHILIISMPYFVPDYSLFSSLCGRLIAALMSL